MTNITTKINEIVAQILEIPITKINENSNSEDIAEWDSMSHVQIIDTIEKAFDIQFDLLEVIELESILDIAQAVARIKNGV